MTGGDDALLVLQRTYLQLACVELLCAARNKRVTYVL